MNNARYSSDCSSLASLLYWNWKLLLQEEIPGDRSRGSLGWVLLVIKARSGISIPSTAPDLRNINQVTYSFHTLVSLWWTERQYLTLVLGMLWCTVRAELQTSLKASTDTQAASHTTGCEKPTFPRNGALPSQDFWEILLVQKLQNLRSEFGHQIFSSFSWAEQRNSRLFCHLLTSGVLMVFILKNNIYPFPISHATPTVKVFQLPTCA